MVGSYAALMMIDRSRLGSGWSRRDVLRIGGVGLAAAWLAACSDGGGSGGQPTGATDTPGPVPGGPFVQPGELVSANGRLEVALTAAHATLPWAAGNRYALAYNGTVPGPTLRVRPGDTLVVTLTNALDAPTNLHTHGLHVSPDGNSDNIFVMVGPGERHTYEYRIPDDHASGTFWYHPHHHGEVARQLSGGLAGVIVVEDAIDALPEMDGATERVLVLSDPRLGTDSSVLDATQQEQFDGREGDAALVNGVYQPALSASAGGMERWRIVNASASRYYELVLTGAPMHLIASDQGRLAAPQLVERLLLTPGQRAEVLVPLAAAGTVVLSTNAVDRAMGMAGMGSGGMGGMGGMGGSGTTLSPAADLLTLAVSGADAAAPALPGALREDDAIDALVPDRERRITFGAMGMGAGEFVIDGKAFAGGRIDAEVALDTVEDWVITNGSMMPHPFHLHVWPFRVVSRSDGSAPDPGWRDTVNIPTGQSVRIRIPFRDFGGTAVYHCHILDHEDLGMMATIHVG
jgi:FtsP/CotA-like multicopper oxidase with cupredoxin domain